MNPMMLSCNRHSLLVECLAQRAEPVAASTHFALYDLNATGNDSVSLEDLVVVHDFTAAQIDNNIGHYVANELLPLFYKSQRLSATDDAWNEQEIFEHYVGEIVRSMDGNERRAWHLFYKNTLAALAQTTGVEGLPQYFIGDFGAIYRQTIALIHELSSNSPLPLTVLDVATCFGFFPLLLAGEGSQKPSTNTLGCDLNVALVDLANDYARHNNAQNVKFVVADILADDIRAVPPLSPTFDVVTAIHLLEHLEPWQTQRAIENLWKLTGQRLIIAVPMEEIPDARFGHRQIFDKKRLMALGRKLGGRCHAFEYHGAWIVIDRAFKQETKNYQTHRGEDLLCHDT